MGSVLKDQIPGPILRNSDSVGLGETWKTASLESSQGDPDAGSQHVASEEELRQQATGRSPHRPSTGSFCDMTELDILGT